MAVLRVARPMRRKRSSVHHFRRRIPRDVLELARGTVIDIPIAPGLIVSKRIGRTAREIVVSLHTRDRGTFRTSSNRSPLARALQRE
jgi:hypothetical protein